MVHQENLLLDAVVDLCQGDCNDIHQVKPDGGRYNNLRHPGLPMHKVVGAENEVTGVEFEERRRGDVFGVHTRTAEGRLVVQAAHCVEGVKRHKDAERDARSFDTCQIPVLESHPWPRSVDSTEQAGGGHCNGDIKEDAVGVDSKIEIVAFAHQ